MAENKPIEITTKLIEKARAAKSADEIVEIADEQGVEMSGEEATSIYASLHEAEGEIVDDELDNVAGRLRRRRDAHHALRVRQTVLLLYGTALPRRSRQPSAHRVLRLQQMRDALGVTTTVDIPWP